VSYFVKRPTKNAQKTKQKKNVTQVNIGILNFIHNSKKVG